MISRRFTGDAGHRGVERRSNPTGGSRGGRRRRRCACLWDTETQRPRLADAIGGVAHDSLPGEGGVMSGCRIPDTTVHHKPKANVPDFV